MSIGFMNLTWRSDSQRSAQIHKVNYLPEKCKGRQLTLFLDEKWRWVMVSNKQKMANIAYSSEYLDYINQFHYVISDEYLKEIETIELSQDFSVKVIHYQDKLYWDLEKITFAPDRLLQEIIRADIGGYNGFASNVYFADSYNSILFYLYDDRGADLVAADKESLRPSYEKFNSWILDYDREKITAIFE